VSSGTDESFIMLVLFFSTFSSKRGTDGSLEARASLGVVKGVLFTFGSTNALNFCMYWMHKTQINERPGTFCAYVPSLVQVWCFLSDLCLHFRL